MKMSWMASWRERQARSRVREIERLEAEIEQLRGEAEVMGDSGAWMVLGDGIEERQEGETWLRHQHSVEAAIRRLELRLEELRGRL